MSKRRRLDTNNHMISELFTFALFGVFMLMALLVVVIGAGGYRNVTTKADTTAEVRTCLGYVAGRVRSDVATQQVSLQTMNGTDVLVLTEEYEGDEYATLIYWFDGALYESVEFAKYMEPEDFDPESGERLTEITSFEAAWAGDNLMAITASNASGHAQTLRLALRAGQGEVAP